MTDQEQPQAANSNAKGVEFGLLSQFIKDFFF